MLPSARGTLFFPQIALSFSGLSRLCVCTSWKLDRPGLPIPVPRAITTAPCARPSRWRPVGAATGFVARSAEGIALAPQILGTIWWPGNLPAPEAFFPGFAGGRAGRRGRRRRFLLRAGLESFWISLRTTISAGGPVMAVPPRFFFPAVVYFPEKNHTPDDRFGSGWIPPEREFSSC